MSEDRLRELLALFGPQARRADPWPIHWIGAGDAGPDYCRPCCKAVAKHARRTRKDPDACVDGGWDGRREADGPSYCAGCGRLLGYSLNTFGLGQEIDHWLEDGDPKRAREATIKRICAKSGAERVADIDSRSVYEGREARAEKPEAATEFVKTLRSLFA